MKRPWNDTGFDHATHFTPCFFKDSIKPLSRAARQNVNSVRRDGFYSCGVRHCFSFLHLLLGLGNWSIAAFPKGIIFLTSLLFCLCRSFLEPKPPVDVLKKDTEKKNLNNIYRHLNSISLNLGKKTIWCNATWRESSGSFIHFRNAPFLELDS